MKITSRQLRQIIKEELARSGFGRLREGAEGAGDTAKDMLNLFTMNSGPNENLPIEALQVDKELQDILDNKLVLKLGDGGRGQPDEKVVKVIQALVKGKLSQAFANQSMTSFNKSPGGTVEIQKSVDELNLDGDFGNKTKNAVMTLQKVMLARAFQLGAKATSPELPTIDGKVGRQTLKFLLSLQGASISGATATSPDEPPGSEQIASTARDLGTSLGPSYKPSTIDKSDAVVPVQTAPINEGRDLTSRLMNRWLK